MTSTRKTLRTDHSMRRASMSGDPRGHAGRDLGRVLRALTTMARAFGWFAAPASGTCHARMRRPSGALRGCGVACQGRPCLWDRLAPAMPTAGCSRRRSGNSRKRQPVHRPQVPRALRPGHSPVFRGPRRAAQSARERSAPARGWRVPVSSTAERGMVNTGCVVGCSSSTVPNRPGAGHHCGSEMRCGRRQCASGRRQSAARISPRR